MKLKPKLRLFVWDNFCPDYTYGIAFAIAKDEATARKLVTDAYCSKGSSPPDVWGDLTIYLLTKPVARAIAGGG